MKKIFLILFMLTGFSSFADNVSHEISGTRIYVGESAVYRIYIETESDIPPYDYLEVPGALVEYAGRQMQTYSQLINGVTSTKKIFIETFYITPEKEGKITIPESKIVLNNKEYILQSYEITVEKPQKNKNYSAKIEYSKKKVYTGEPVTADFYFDYSGPARNLHFRNLFALRNKMNDEELDPEMKPDEVQITARYNGIEIQAAYNQNKHYVRLRRRFTPLVDGTVKSDDIVVQFEGTTGQKDFFGSYVYSKMVIPCEGPSFRVTPLPLAGQPDDFSGIIGSLEINISAVPVEASVGEPITLEITMEGDIPGDYDLPDLSEIRVFAEDFSFPFEHSAGKNAAAKMVFIQTIRPKNPEISEIPSISINYFNSITGKYEYAYSNTVPLIIHSANVSAMSDIYKNDNESEAQKDSNINEKGIRYNYDSTEIMNDLKKVYNDVNIKKLYLFIVFSLLAAFSVYLILSFLIRSGKKEKQNYNKNSIDDLRSHFMKMIFSILKIREHSNLSRLKEQIRNSGQSEKWKENVFNGLGILFNYKMDNNMKINNMNKLIFNLEDRKLR